jgi:hypothetical protein
MSSDEQSEILRIATIRRGRYRSKLTPVELEVKTAELSHPIESSTKLLKKKIVIKKISDEPAPEKELKEINKKSSLSETKMTKKQTNVYDRNAIDRFGKNNIDSEPSISPLDSMMQNLSQFLVIEDEPQKVKNTEGIYAENFIIHSRGICRIKDCAGKKLKFWTGKAFIEGEAVPLKKNAYGSVIYTRFLMDINSEIITTPGMKFLKLERQVYDIDATNMNFVSRKVTNAERKIGVDYYSFAPLDVGNNSTVRRYAAIAFPFLKHGISYDLKKSYEEGKRIASNLSAEKVSKINVPAIHLMCDIPLNLEYQSRLALLLGIIDQFEYKDHPQLAAFCLYPPKELDSYDIARIRFNIITELMRSLSFNISYENNHFTFSYKEYMRFVRLCRRHPDIHALSKKIEQQYIPAKAKLIKTGKVDFDEHNHMLITNPIFIDAKKPWTLKIDMDLISVSESERSKPDPSQLYWRVKGLEGKSLYVSGMIVCFP